MNNVQIIHTPIMRWRGIICTDRKTLTENPHQKISNLKYRKHAVRDTRTAMEQIANGNKFRWQMI